MLSIIKKTLAQPFRNADQINNKVIVQWLNSLSGSFLEIGPGSNPLIGKMNPNGKNNLSVIEFPEILDYCKSLGFTCYGQNASIEKWAPADDSMDVVVSNQCLEHIPDTDHFICEAKRVLKKRGKFIISVPNQGALAFIILQMLTINPPMNYVSDRFYGLGNPLSNIRWKKREAPGHAHLRLFMTRAMNDLLKAYDFKVLKNHGGSWGTPIGGELFARLFPYYGLYTTVLAEKK